MSELPPPPPGAPIPPPPGPTGYPAPPPAHPEQGFVGQYHHGFERIGGNARSITILLGIYAALQILGIPVQFAVRSKARDYLAGTISADTFKEAINPLNALNALQSGATIAIAIITMIWMRRMIRNHRLLGRPYSTWGPGWAIGGWFLPPGAVYAIPWLIFKELWRGSDPANVPNDPSWKQRPVAPIVHVWWICYGFLPLVSGVVGAGFTFSSLNGLADESNTQRLAEIHTDLFAVQLITSAVMLVAVVVYGKLVRDLTRRQQALTGAG